MRPSNVLWFYSFFFLSSCAHFVPQFSGPVFLHDRIPEELCTEEIQYYGIYRILDNGEREYLPYCSIEIRDYVGSHHRDVVLVEEPQAE